MMASSVSWLQQQKLCLLLQQGLSLLHSDATSNIADDNDEAGDDIDDDDDDDDDDGDDDDHSAFICENYQIFVRCS